MNRDKLRLRFSYAAQLGPLTVGCTASTPAEHVVECDGTRTKEDQREGQAGGGQGKLVPRTIRRSHKPVVQMNFPQRHDQVDADGQGGNAGKEARREATVRPRVP